MARVREYSENKIKMMEKKKGRRKEQGFDYNIDFLNVTQQIKVDFINSEVSAQPCGLSQREKFQATVPAG